MAAKGKGLAVEANTVRFPPEVWAVLKAHAYQRNVTVNRLLKDITTCYLVYITDFNHPYFTPRALGFPPLTPPTDVKPGYLESLGFVPPHEGDTSIAPPAPGYANHKSSDVESEADLAFLHFDQKESA